MAETGSQTDFSFKETVMRFAPPAAALALVFALSASIGQSQTRAPDPRAVAMAGEGRAQLAAGQTQAAIDTFEAALAVDPSLSEIYLDLAAAARADGLQGKAIHFYREAQARNPDNFAAIAGEGQALAAKGAMTAARENLAELETRCGAACPETRALAAAIAGGAPVLTADALSPDTQVTQN